MAGPGKTMAESFQAVLCMDLDDFEAAAQDAGLSVQDRIAVSVCMEAMNGNVKAAKYVLDLTGGQQEQPKTKAKVTPFERIAKQRAGAPARKPVAAVPNSA